MIEAVRAAGLGERRPRGRRPAATASRRAGAGAGAIAGWIAPGAAFAYHDTLGFGGGAGLEALLPIVGAVAVGMIALAIWGRRRRRTRRKDGKRKQRGASPHATRR